MIQVKYNTEVKDGLKRGVDALANAVKVTLGPKGRNVIIEKYGDTPHITKDGVTVAEAITLEDPLENMGAQIVKDVASKSAMLAGDGTTTSTVITQAIVREGLKLVEAGFNPLDLKKGIDIAVSALVIELEKNSIKVNRDSEMIKQIASISANNDNEIGELIAEAFLKVGEEGVVSVEESKSRDTFVKVINGMQFDRGLVSHFFSTDQKEIKVKMNDAHVIIADKNLSKIEDVMFIIEPLAKTGKNIMIIANEIDGQALSTLTLNKLKAGVKVAAVKAPGFGAERSQLLLDIGALVGCKVIKEGTTFLTREFIGGCENVTATERNTIIVGGHGDLEDISYRVAYLKETIDSLPTDIEKKRVKARIAKLAGGVGVIYVGANSELEMKEKKDRIDDAKEAVLSAIEEGIVAGGGVALLEALNTVEVKYNVNSDEIKGIEIVKRAITAPLQEIAINAGKSGEVVLNQVILSQKGIGYDAKNDKYVNMIDSGIIDPKKVTRVALESASSVAGTILTTECALITKRLG